MKVWSRIAIGMLAAVALSTGGAHAFSELSTGTDTAQNNASQSDQPSDQAKPQADDSQPDGKRVSNPVAQFTGIDKITGRIINFDVYINETVQFGALQVTPRVCYSRPGAETPKTDSFVEVDEITLDRKIRRIFTGWMFAESPGLNAVEHPVYDVWLKDCKQKSDVPAPGDAASAQTSAPDATADAPAAPDAGSAAPADPAADGANASTDAQTPDTAPVPTAKPANTGDQGNGNSLDGGDVTGGGALN